MTTRLGELSHSATTLIGLCAIVVAGFTASCFSERVTSNGPPIDPAVCQAVTPPAGFVLIRNFTFQPAQLTVSAGTSVTWVNCESDGTAHTSTSDGAGWDSGLLSPLTGFARTFSQTGSFAYHCEPHPGMRGTIVVQ